MKAMTSGIVPALLQHALDSTVESEQLSVVRFVMPLEMFNLDWAQVELRPPIS